MVNNLYNVALVLGVWYWYHHDDKHPGAWCIFWTTWVLWDFTWGYHDAGSYIDIACALICAINWINSRKGGERWTRHRRCCLTTSCWT
jgi:hypothetical protein